MFCKYFQWRLDACLENQVSPSDSLLGHLQKCLACRQYYRQISRIDQHLRTQNPDLPDFDEKNLQKKILARLPKNPSRSSSSFLHFNGLPMAAGLAAAVLFGAGLWLLMHIPRPNPMPPTRADLLRFNQLVSSERIPLRSSLIRQSMHQPLEKEFDNLSQDMQRAVAFFSACLPQAQDRQMPSGNR
jgi:hypothetical protein